MKIQVTGRHGSVSEEVRAYVVEKAVHLSKYFDRIGRVEVVVDAEGRKNEYSVELIVHAPRGTILVGEATGKSTPAAMDVVVVKMERQLKKFKGRLRSKKSVRSEATELT